MSNTTVKTCSNCHLELPTTEFHKDAASNDGYRSHCQECRQSMRQVPGQRAKQAMYYARYKRRLAEKRLGHEIKDDLHPYHIALIQGETECIYCQKELQPGETTVDHVRNFYSGGTNEYSNLLP